MDSAIYALIVNAVVAGLFAVTFGIIRLSYPEQRYASWFAVTYLFGGLMPISELGVRSTPFTIPFMILSYGSFLLSLAMLLIGLASMAGRRRPWRAFTLLVVGGTLVRTAIWNGPNNQLLHELLFQSPYIAGSAMAAAIAVGAVRKRRDPLWLALGITLALLTLYFALKPFFAAAFGSGSDPIAHSTSSYALLSQSVGGVLVVAVGLVTLLLVVQAAMGQSIAESETDPLTGIANRRGFNRQARVMIAEARARGFPVAAILFDLDHFKQVNDRYGHATGDAVLRAFAGVLVDRLPRSAVIARLGGEEFVGLLDRTTLRGAWLSAQSVRATLPAIATHLPAVTVSGGLAVLLPDDDIDSLLERADRAVYAAKRAGRDRILPMPDPVQAEPLSLVRNR
ncbi:diguanylate cyclase domain-containing protein [Sphingomonas sp. SAFR-052]|uniref:GGDEF domain-containing protein n=1 Tax=Sphingomonas sp. SAFR-052 TaxID=3436867 RepID=UPI003F7D90E2